MSFWLDIFNSGSRNSGSVGAWSPSTLFNLGQPGFWYDVQDLSSMWQDSAGTTPAAVDAVVGKVNDKSGNARHLTQVTAENKPILRQAGGFYHLQFDGSDDWLETASFAWGSDHVSIYGALDDDNIGVVCCIAEFGPTSVSTTETWGLLTTGTPSAAIRSMGTTTSRQIGAGQPAGWFLARGRANPTTPLVGFKLNNDTPSQAGSIQGATNYGTQKLFVGRRNGSVSPFTGKIAGLIARNSDFSAGEDDATRNYLNSIVSAY